ncbi:site-specific integrase [Schinkia azotoformans]|uniref:site-specific integrase n=1 Tax=Schinkia azotoformans TaxID=1454 RepID=UPI002E1CAF91|nr:site-specific integrase [Schinkia azotoformans]
MLPTEHNLLSLTDTVGYLQYQQVHQENIKQIIKKSKSENTIRALATDIRLFEVWCNEHNQFRPEEQHHKTLPSTPHTVISYLMYLKEQGMSYSTIKRKLSSISTLHELKKLENPTKTIEVQTFMTGLANDYKENNLWTKGKRALTWEELKQMVDTIDLSKSIGIRDKAILLIGFMTASRRSELVSIRAENIQFITGKGIVINIFQAKTKEWIKKAVAMNGGKYCPVSSLLHWMYHSYLIDPSKNTFNRGYVFRSIDRHGNIDLPSLQLGDKTVAMIVKKYAERIGKNQEYYAGHSLRKGLPTEVQYDKDYDLRDIMRQTGHKSEKTLKIYMQTLSDENLFRNNITNKLR